MLRCPEPSCGLLWLDPPPTGDELARAYRDYFTHAPPRPRWSEGLRRSIKAGYYASRYGYRPRGVALKRMLALGLALRPGLRAGLDGAILYLEPRSGGRVLDVGCGDGRMLAQLRELGWDVEGVESDPAAARVAAARGVPVRPGSLEQQGYPAASFDAVTLNHVLEHVTDPAATLAECRRVLRPGGRLALATPNAAGLGHATFGRAWRGLEPPRHLHVFTAPALERLLRSARLGILALRTSANGAEFVHVESRRIGGDAEARPDDAAARRFARAERRRMVADPWAGEELVLTATPA